jgi:hypothetical protein
MKKAIILPVHVCLHFCLAFSVLGAQENMRLPSSLEVPPAPVISELAAVCTGNTVTLTWKQAPDIDGESIIFRANRPITAANYFSAEKRGEVPASATTFNDTIENGKDYYYAVLSRDSRGNLYEFFLPVSNSLLVAVSTEAGIIPSEETAFSSFDTITRNDAVILSWKTSSKNQNVVIYRSTSPFSDMNSLVQAIVVTSFTDTGTPYVDYPVPGVPYYYSILDEDAIRTGSVTFNPGFNTNGIPVEIPSIFARIQRTKLLGIRPMPLPFLNPSQTPVTPLWRFSPATETKITALKVLSARKNEPLRTPYVFLSDIETNAAGEEYSLKKILETSFLVQNWNETTASLTQFLTIRRTPETTARAHFYLGEAYYFTGDYHKALLEFLLVQDLYYNQAREWIQYVMDKMV